ncbi:MAG: hypothetical protein QTN59_03790 [Candidatus Electrothrix communis]|nr:MAG: hypothetical protein QTN59_03790 [Candidatus Electrothrix communis]
MARDTFPLWIIQGNHQGFLQALRKHKPGLYAEVKDELSLDYLQDNFDLTEKDKDKARGRIKEMAKDLYLLKTSFEHHHQVGHYQTFKTLAQVFDQQCAVKSENDLSSSPADVDSDKELVEAARNTAPVDSEEEISSGNMTPADESADSTKNIVPAEPEIEIRAKPVGDKIRLPT